jgi:hypothetical protein
MDEWTSHNSNPSRLWKSLKKDNPNLDEQFFRLPNGGWDITRLKQAVDEKNQLSQKIKQEESKILTQLKFEEEQRIMWLEGARIKSSKEVEFDTFRIGLGMFFIPAVIQLWIFFAMVSGPLAHGLEVFYDTWWVLIISNLVMWSSVPVMTMTLAKQVNKLDQHLKHLN